MITAEVAFNLLLVLIGFGFSALYSGLETGLYTINTVRLTVRASRADATARRIRNEMRHPDRTLIVLLIGTNASNYLGTFGLAELLKGAVASDGALIVVEAAVITPLLFVFAETLPKDLFRTHTDRWTYWFAPLLTISRWVFTILLLLPFVQAFSHLMRRLLGGSSRRSAVTARLRISQLIKEGVGAGVLSESQTTLADRALALRDRTIADVYVAWSEVTSLRADASPQERIRRFRDRNFTRVPVVDARGRVLGILGWTDGALHTETPVRDLVQPALHLAPQTKLFDAITTMRRQKQTMAIIARSETTRPLGIVTLKDLVEPLTGKLAAW